MLMLLHGIENVPWSSPAWQLPLIRSAPVTITRDRSLRGRRWHRLLYLRCNQCLKARLVRNINFSFGEAFQQLLGRNIDKLDLIGLVDHAIVIPSDDTARVQECHITMGHILCELVEKHLASNGGAA